MYKEKIAALFPVQSDGFLEPVSFYNVPSVNSSIRMVFTYCLFNMIPGYTYSLKFSLHDFRDKNIISFEKKLVLDPDNLNKDGLTKSIQQLGTPFLTLTPIANQFKLTAELYKDDKLLDSAATYAEVKFDDLENENA